MSATMNPFLREQLVEILNEHFPTEFAFVDGETFEAEALDIARAYMAATGRQRRALEAVVESWAVQS